MDEEVFDNSAMDRTDLVLIGTSNWPTLLGT
jgi:hypothetical protein